MSNSAIETGTSNNHLHDGVDGVLEDGSVGSVTMVAEMGGGDTLKVASVMAQDEDGLDQGLQDEVHYVTTDESGQAVTIVYPQSALPMYQDGSLVNFVELPQGGIALDQSGYTSTQDGQLQVLQQNFNGAQPNYVIQGEHGGQQIALLEQAEHGGNHAITYLTQEDGSGSGAGSILGSQLIQLPAMDSSGAPQTITLPLSFLGGDGAGVSILQGIQGLPQLQLPLPNENMSSLEGGDSTITLAASSMDADVMSPGRGPEVNSVLTQLSAATVVPTTSAMETHNGDLGVSFTSLAPMVVSNKKSQQQQYQRQQQHQQQQKGFFMKTPGATTTKQQSQNSKKLIGSGPLAISAQGVVQKIGNRLVTVLPRPEDLKKLQESKSLIVSVRGGTTTNTYATSNKSSAPRRVPVPVRPHQRYGRRGRGGTVAGARSKFAASQDELKHTVLTKTVSLLKRPDDMGDLSGSFGDIDSGLSRVKMEHSDSDGNIVVSMTLPGGAPASALLLKESADQDLMLHDFTPNTGVRGRGRKRKRGRGRPRGTYVINSTGRRPGRPRKVETLMQGPHGARMIHTGPDTREADIVLQEGTLAGAPEGTSTLHLSIEGEVESAELVEGEVDPLALVTFKQEHHAHEDQEGLEVHEEEESEILVKDEPQDGSRRRLPPRKRGARYEKMLAALKKPDYDDDDYSMGEEEDISPDYLTYRRPAPPPKPRGTSGPGKRGRPRKNLFTTISVKTESQLSQHDMKDERSSINALNETAIEQLDASDDHEKHNLLITFQRPETGEMVITMLPPPPSSEDGGPTHTITHTTVGDEEDESTILITECANGGGLVEAHKCSECNSVFELKRDYLRHLRTQHNIRPFQCLQCGKTCTSSQALQAHMRFHGLERPHRCDYCGKGFNDASHLKSHLATHTGERPHKCIKCPKAFAQASQLKKHLSIHEETHSYRCTVCDKTFAHRDTLYTHMKIHSAERPFQCDICSLGFVTSSGLNRHRKVHKRGSSPITGLDEDLKCQICQANFTYRRTLTKHMATVHGQGSNIKEEDDPLDNDIKPATLTTVTHGGSTSLVEQLKEQLDSGYAPRTSELYDEPSHAETLENLNQNNPFKCGICEESFTDVDVLCDHYTSCHTGEQELYCEVCSVGCATEAQLQQHRNLHIFEEQQSIIQTQPTDQFPFVCHICGKSFKKLQELTRHHRIHTQEKNHKCDLCGAGFPLKSALDKHVLVHTGERPFKCDICLKSFRQSAALVRHKLWTHRLKNQNKCELCGKTFFTPALLQYHLDSHGEPGQRVKDRIQQLIEDDQQFVDASDHNSIRIDLGVDGSHTGGDGDINQNNNDKHSCEYCGNHFSSYVALLTHKLTHKLSASYKCDVCHRTFREKRYLQKHKLTHKGVKSWKCDICKKAFATKLTLIRHSHVHLREALRPGPETPLIPEEGEDGEPINSGSTLPAILKCDDCGIDFAHKSHYVRHKLLHSGTPLLKCGLCDRLFVHKSDIIRHKVMHSFMFTCDICGRNFHKRSLFLMHKKKHVDEKPFKCECGKSFATSGNYNTHKRIHSGEKPYACDLCDYRCSQSGRLLKHKRMHSGEKPFQCPNCGKSFANAESVKIHMRIHTGERPFKCGNCGKTFINNSSLNQHMRDHIREEMFKCDLCSHKFRREHHLVKHRQFHLLQQQYQNTLGSSLNVEGESNVDAPLYMCEVCGRVFDKKKYLYTHHNVHSRQRNFPCTHCGKHLASRLALKNHNLIHTGEMPYKCCMCDKEFRSSSNLKRHERTHSSTHMNEDNLQHHHSQQPEVFRCEFCDETFFSGDALNQHKSTAHNHMQGMMMMSSGMDSSVVGGVGGPGGDNSHHLYVFETVGEVAEAMDSTQQLLVDHNSQQQFLVDGSQPLLVFPETATESYSQLPGEPEDNIDPEPHMEPVPEHPDTPEVIMVQEKMEEGIEHEEMSIDKPFRCDDCGKTFAKKQYLTKHKYRHREVKPHPCDVCGKRFAQKFEVAVHKIKHTGERPYSCDVCHKPFRSKVNLLNHKMRHTGEYPFLCSVCRKGFSTQLQLERHVTLHTGSHPYKCHICHKGYTQRTNLIKHLAKAHHVLQLGGDGECDQTPRGLHTMDGYVSPGAVGVQELEGSVIEAQGGEDSEDDDQGPGAHGQHHPPQEELTMEGHELLVAEDDQQEPAFSVVEVHPDYLKDYLLAGPQVVSTHDMDPKLLQSILEAHGSHQRQADQTQQITDVNIRIAGQDNQAIVHVNAMDDS